MYDTYDETKYRVVTEAEVSDIVIANVDKIKWEDTEKGSPTKATVSVSIDTVENMTERVFEKLEKKYDNVILSAQIKFEKQLQKVLAIKKDDSIKTSFIKKERER